MDVMMKISPVIRRIRIGERPCYISVTEPIPREVCISSASYGLRQGLFKSASCWNPDRLKKEIPDHIRSEEPSSPLRL